MTVINLDPKVTAFGVEGWTDEVVFVYATPWANRQAATRVEGSKMILPERIVKQVSSSTLLELSPTTVEWCWKITVESTRRGYSSTKFFAVPNEDTIDWADLVEVDPMTMLSTPGVTAAQALLTQVQQLVSSLEAGAKGDDGDDGIDGKSAYQLALDAGFVGTIDAWLTSLRGTNGNDGGNGDKGDKGDGFLYLEAGVSVPGGTPIGTVIVRPFIPEDL